MPTITIDDLTVRLASELQNTFNPTYAFGGKSHGGSLALRETPSGHLLLPYDAEGNVIVTPGRRYQLVLVTERKDAQEKMSNTPQQQLRNNVALEEGKEKFKQATESGREDGVTPVANGEGKKQGRKRKNDMSVPTPEETPQTKDRREKKETATRTSVTENDDNVPLYHRLGEMRHGNTTVDNARPPPSSVTTDKSPKSLVAMKAPTAFSSSSDDDNINSNIPLSAYHTKQQQQQPVQKQKQRQQERQIQGKQESTPVTSVAVSHTQKPSTGRQTKPPRRPPIATSSTSDSD